MKRIFKNPIFTFFFGAILFGSIGVVTAYALFANEIEYTPRDESWKKEDGEDIVNVEEAIDELYDKWYKYYNLDLSVSTDYNIIHAHPYSTSLSLQMNIGKYIVLFDEHYSGGTQTSGYQSISTSGFSINTSNGTCNLLDNKFYENGSYGTYSGSWRKYAGTHQLIYMCAFKQSGSVSISLSSTAEWQDPINATLRSIKLY